MKESSLIIDGLCFSMESGTPFQYAGIHSGVDLSGIDIEVTAYSDEDISSIKELLQRDKVNVIDPFAGRTYDATIRRKSDSYTVGQPGRRYNFEVKELDEAKQFDTLEIEGNRFQVIRSVEKLHDDVIGLYALLHLSQEDFDKFHSLLLKPGPFQVRRLGIDENPIVRRFGGALYWSAHHEGPLKIYKQIVRFFPTDFPGSKFVVAPGQEHFNQSRMLVALSARFEALVGMLVDNGQLSRENGESLISEEWGVLINEEREASIRSQLTEVKDAELELG